jgi:hypothetical protein
MEQVARTAWAIRVLERQEMAIFAAHKNPFRNETARRSLLGVTALRSHYSATHQASLRLFLKLANLEKRRRQSVATTSPAKRTR